MKLFPEEPVFVVGEAGFDTVVDGQKLDVLGRKPLGQKLTDLVDRIDQPLVIALDGGWGSGKSHFLKLWTGAHAKELGGRAEVIYFDAFEHDFLDDPLVSLVSRLTADGAEKTWGTKAIDRVKKAAFPLAKLAARVGLAAATAGEIANAVGDAALGKAADAADATIDQFWKTEANRIAAMQGFRKALADLTTPKKDGETPRKIVFIVDELDRCRPDYALSMLEIIKHFFAVPNVHFVLGVNLEALAQSVRARYGSSINGSGYLQKFVHLTFRLPNPFGGRASYDWGAYFDHLSASMDLPEPRSTSAKQKLELYSQKQPVSLRDVQRVTARLALLASDIDNSHWGLLSVATTAVILQVLSPQHFQKLRQNALNLSEIDELFSLTSGAKDSTFVAEAMKYCWERVLLEEPSQACLAYTKQAFSHHGMRDSAFDLLRFIATDLDVFHLK